MQTKLRLSILLVVLSSAPLLRGAGLVNGDFESPSVAGTGQAYDTTPAGFGWTLAWGQVEIYNSGWTTAASGNQCLDLDGWAPGGIYQDFTFGSSGSWQIQFAMAPNPDTATAKSLTASLTPLGGTKIDLGTFTLSPSGRSWADLKWESEVTAPINVDASTTYRLQFDSVTGGASGAIIDNVRLVQTVPEPGSGLLLLCGFALGGRRLLRGAAPKK